jgi:hypothetical protein
VVSADVSTDPLVVELMTDRLGGKRSDVTPDQMRAGLRAIAHTILTASPDSVISLRTFDSQAIQVVKPTSSVVQLDNTIKKFFSNNGNSVLLDAVADASEDLRKAKNGRRVIIGLVAGYMGDTSSVSSLATAQRLRQSGASFWVLEVVGAGMVASPKRDVILTDGTRDSGGFHATVATGTAIEAAATRMAGLVLSQYAVTYAAPSGAADRRVDVQVRGEGMRVLAPHWAAMK